MITRRVQVPVIELTQFGPMKGYLIYFGEHAEGISGSVRTLSSLLKV